MPTTNPGHGGETGSAATPAGPGSASGRRSSRIAVLPGDGIGPEVIGEALLLAEELRRGGLLAMTWEVEDWGGERYLATGDAMPPGGVERLRAFDAILIGAFGDPRVPESESLRRVLLGIRFGLDLFINMRPVRCLEERLNPLKHVKAADIDLVIMRENTEGSYCGAGGTLRAGTAEEMALQEMVVTRKGVERIVRAAFDLARSRPRRKVTLVDKANALQFAGEVWQRTFAGVASQYGDVASDHLYADVAAMEMVRNPGRFDVIVTENLLGDILSDLAAMLAGGLGLAASANLHPGRVSMFEPVHGSAPDIAGTGQANPLAAFASFALLLRHIGQPRLGEALEAAIAETVRDSCVTRDLGGSCSTAEVGTAVRERMMNKVGK
jgi:3-isopropylmalate dehydrogenase